MLEPEILSQVRSVFEALQSTFTFHITVGNASTASAELRSFIQDFAGTSDKLTVAITETAGNDCQFSIVKDGKETGIVYRGIPGGHEFTSLLLAVLNADGKGKNLLDDGIIRRIQRLNTPIDLTSYISLTCTNCPEVVQALQVMALYNEGITHTLVDGAVFEEEVNALKIQAVPTVFANGEQLSVGKSDLATLLGKLEEKYGTADSANDAAVVRPYDVVVVGGGPAGSSAAIYSARKGLKVAVVAERIGGQVKDTVGIENLISQPYTTGAELADNLRAHIGAYPIDLYEHRSVERVEVVESEKRLYVKGGEVFTAPAVIVATGASWRKLGVPGEELYIGRGVAFCPHCDGPFYAGKDVAVIGGGNSGVEAAIDLAGICAHVTLFEFMDTLKADTVLQEKLRSLPNVRVFVSQQSVEVLGNGEKVTALKVKDRHTGEEVEHPLDGIFVQIGLAPNTLPFREVVECTPQGEIKVDAHCRTSQAGIYGAGDATTVPYKQIVVAMGEGAKASLSAFDDRIRGTLRG